MNYVPSNRNDLIIIWYYSYHFPFITYVIQKWVSCKSKFVQNHTDQFLNIVHWQTIWNTVIILWSTFYGAIYTCKDISMGLCKKDVTPSLVHWSYVFLALTHWYVITFVNHLINHSADSLSSILLFLLLITDNTCPCQPQFMCCIQNFMRMLIFQTTPHYWLVHCRRDLDYSDKWFKVLLWLLLFINYTDSFSQKAVLNG